MINVHVVGMSHIDLGFTLTENELSELLEIFAERMLSVLDRHPDICYSIEQMYHYRKLQKNRPDLFERLKQYIAQGRIEVMGAMASSMETNFPNGECFIRNQKLGLQWAKDNFGVTPKSAWLVDTFGLNAQIPQIYKQFGFEQLFANRFGGDKCHELFEALGIDGTKLLVIGRDCASPQVMSKYLSFRLCRGWSDTEALFEHADCLDGEGPRLVTNYIENEEVLSLRYVELTKDRADRKNENWKLSSYQAYIDELIKKQREYPVLSADLNPEFTGTFALRALLKVRNREIETKLMEAEKWNALADSGCSLQDFDEAWWDMAFIQFHDVFTGSHGDRTYHNVCDKFNKIDEICTASLNKSLNSLTLKNSSAFSLFNGLATQRTEWIEVPHNLQSHEIMHNGKPLPTALRNGKKYCQVTLPPVSAITCIAGGAASDTALTDTKLYRIENEFLRLEVDKNNGSLCLYLADGTPIIENADDFLTAQEDIGGFQIEAPNGGEVFASSGSVKVLPAQKDLMGERIVVLGEFADMNWNNGENCLKWSIEYQLNYHESMLRMKILLDWLGEGTRVRLNIPTCVNSSEAVYEIPFGVSKRTAYRPRQTAKGEWPAQRFVAFEDSEKGIALANRGIAGVEVNGRTLSTTLLRAYYPGPMAWVPPTAETSGHGKSSYEFMLIPYKGSWKAADVVHKALAFNNPVLCFDGSELRGSLESFIKVDKKNIILSAVKNASDCSDDIIVRLYEAYGDSTQTTITIKGAISAKASDVDEADGESLACNDGQISLDFEPFEIKTIRIKRGCC